MDGSATFTIVVSSTIITSARQSRYSASQRLRASSVIGLPNEGGPPVFPRAARSRKVYERITDARADRQREGAEPGAAGAAAPARTRTPVDSAGAGARRRHPGPV